MSLIKPSKLKYIIKFKKLKDKNLKMTMILLEEEKKDRLHKEKPNNY